MMFTSHTAQLDIEVGAAAGLRIAGNNCGS
jgi:hypothetical protein